MKNNNYVLIINGQPSIIYRSARKLVWLALPELNLISKFYTRSNFLQTSSTGCLFVLDKNCISFLTVNLPPLRLNVFRQEFLDWQPLGGICMSHMLILYNKHTINFYDRGNTLKKTWTIQVMQEISQIKSSPLQKVIGMMVIQKNNTIFLWNINDISNKPFQEITISEKIVKWEFYQRDMLIVLTERQFQVYFPAEGHYSLQYFLQFAHLSRDFCFFDRPKTREHSGRRMIFPIGILSDQGKIFIYQLYDIDKRLKNSSANVIAVIQTQKNTKSILCGYEKDSTIVVCTELANGKPLNLTLTHQFLPINRWKYQSELNTDNPNKIQYCKQIICVENRKKIGDLTKSFQVFRIHGKDQYQFLTRIQVEGEGILGGYNFFSFEGERLSVFKKSEKFSEQSKITIEGVKFKNLVLLQQGESFAYFVSGIRIIKLDLNEKKAKVDGFVVKNEKFALVQVRNQTRSLLYKSNQEYILFEFKNNQNSDLAKNKLEIKLIKSSAYKIVSLRNARWIQKHPDKILLGEANRLLIQFDLTKFFKLLTQQNQLIDYEVYWTTHDGILLFIKNYLFVLQLTQSSDGYSLNFIKRSLNYLHCRFDPDANGIRIIDARSLVISQGSRVLKLGTKLGNFIGEDPYSLPDTLLRRQLLMRKLYPPHHPKIIQYLIQIGNFNLLTSLFSKLWNWLTQGSPQIIDLYNEIGLEFFMQNKQINNQQKPKQQSLEDENPLKKCCELILENPHLLQLEQNGSLILQSQIQAVIFRQQNSRSLDFYSEIVLTQFKTFEAKNENFRTMHIAYLIHSNNKQEAIGILKQKSEMEWDWMKKYSIPIWYDIKNEIRGWTQEIGSNLFKNSKQPFDCLFWYTITNKKNILIQLFKKYIYNTPQHEKIVKFLQRDFNDPKNRNAAVNNAYALVDKKRYLHALAFFIYGQKIDEAISVCLNKLKDFNLAFLICILMEDSVNKSKLLDILYKQGDIWAKHIALFFKGQHIQSFNVLFQDENVESTLNWNYEPKIVNFHPCAKQFAVMIEKSVPVKRELQEQKLSKIKNDPNDIFDSFFGGGSQEQVQEQLKQEKILMPKYQQFQKESVNYYIHNSCPILALTIDPTNYRANRAYDLCRFMLTKQVNSTVAQLIEEMEDYISIIKSKLKEGKPYENQIETIQRKIRDSLQNFRFSSVITTMKSCIGQLMYFARLGEDVLMLIKKDREKEKEDKSKELQSLILISKGFLIVQLQITELFQRYSKELVSAVRENKLRDSESEGELKDFWSITKSYYDKIPEPKKNKKQNLYDEFEQSLYKYVYKKGQFSQQNTNFSLTLEDSVTVLYKKIFIEYMQALFSQDNSSKKFKQLLKRPALSFASIIKKWVDAKMSEQLQKQYLMMLNEGSVAKLKLSILPVYLQNKFQEISRSFTIMKSTSLRKIPSEKNQSSKVISEKPEGQEVIQIFRNKLQCPRFIALNKNEGNGMEVAIVTKKGIRKIQVCDSLLNRTRSQDGVSLIHDDNMLNIESKFDFTAEQKYNNLPIVDYFFNALMDNRKEYDGVGIIKGSTKRISPEYLRALDPVPFMEPSEIFSIQTHHFLPIFMVGAKSNIQICQFSTKSNYNRIKCPNLSQIIKVRSYEQRVTGLDNQGNLSSFSFDTKISGTPVFNMKKSSVIDFCLMTPSTYGVCTNNSIQVIDSLLHPKKQVVFKVQTNQTPICLDYFSNTKLAVCRRSDLVIYDTRMDVLQQTRDLAGKAKCMTSNHKNRVLVGKTDNKVRILDLGRDGGEQDYDIKCISNNRGADSMDRSSIEAIEVMGRIAISLSSEGILSMFLVD